MEIEILTCRNRARKCNAVIGSTDRPVAATGRLLDDVRHLATDCVALWCKRCNKATEYRYLNILKESA